MGLFSRGPKPLNKEYDTIVRDFIRKHKGQITEENPENGLYRFTCDDYRFTVIAYEGGDLLMCIYLPDIERTAERVGKDVEQVYVDISDQVLVSPAFYLDDDNNMVMYYTIILNNVNEDALETMYFACASQYNLTRDLLNDM